MIPKDLLINRPASPAIRKIAEKQFKKDDAPLFAVIGDLDINSNYGDIPGYVKTELGLTDSDIEKLQNLYTQ